jgi:RNA polymerase sigma factor (TIGR02999 family)
MTMRSSHEVTRLLLDWRDGDKAALDALMPLVFDELRRLAAGQLRHERPDHTLQPTALVNEAYLQLVEQRQMNWQTRAHFFGAAAGLMRRILVDHARAHKAAKRGGDAIKVSLSDVTALIEQQSLEVLLLDQALTELEVLDPPLAQLVELRYFAELSIEETAAVLKLSPATVKRHWNSAKVWLHRRLTQGATNDDALAPPDAPPSI